MSSLRNRVFFATAFVAIFTIGLAVRFVTTRVSREAESTLLRGLEEAATLVEEHYAARLDTLRLTARLVADLPKLKAAVATDDPPTVLPLARDYREQVHSAVLVLTNADGDELVSLGADGPQLLDRESIRRAIAGEEVVRLRTSSGRLMQLVTMPIVIGPDPPEVLGTLSLGYVLDDELARGFKAVTQSEVALAVDERVVASSFPLSIQSQLPIVADLNGTSIVLDQIEYVALSKNLSPGAGSGELYAVLFRSRTEQLSLLRTFRASVLIAGLIGMLAATMVSYAVARTVTRPLTAITATMGEITSTGDLTRKIRLKSGIWDDEDATLLARAFNTLTESISRFQKEVSVRERFSALGRMSAVIAHEIRNPLMIIKTSVRTLQHGQAGSEETREAVDDIDHEIRRLGRIVDDVLDFARPVRLEVTTTDLNDLCRETVDAMTIDHEGPEIRLSLDPAVGTIETDPERLRTALVNVLGNAKDAVVARQRLEVADANDVPALLAVELQTTRVAKDRVAITVLDHGCGIAADDLDKIFEPYFTSKRKGTGLGLAITKNIVDSLGGVLFAASGESRPTEIRIELTTPPNDRDTADPATVSSRQRK